MIRSTLTLWLFIEHRLLVWRHMLCIRAGMPLSVCATLIILLWSSPASCSIAMPPPSGQSFPRKLRSAVHNLAMEFGHQIQPQMLPHQSKALADALQVSSRDLVTPSPPASRPNATRLDLSERSEHRVLVVDADRGSDSQLGTAEAPLRTLAHAVVRARALQGSAIVQLQGVFSLEQALHLGPSDSGLTIESVQGSQAEVTGALPLDNLRWNPYQVRVGVSG